MKKQRYLYAPQEYLDDVAKIKAKFDYSDIQTIPGQAEGLSTIIDRYLRFGIQPDPTLIRKPYFDTADNNVAPEDLEDTSKPVDLDDVPNLTDNLAKMQERIQYEQNESRRIYEEQRMKAQYESSRASEAEDVKPDVKQ